MAKATATAEIRIDSPVTHLEARVLAVPLDPIIITANYNIPDVYMVLLRLRTADGATGHGCLWVFGVPQARILVDCLRYLAPFVSGHAPEEVGFVMADLRREVNFLGFKGVSVFGLSAYDQAMHDALCHQLGVSWSALRGRRRDSIPVYWSGLFLNQTEEELVEETRRIVDMGIRAVKFRVGKPTFKEDEHRLDAVMAELPEGAVLMLDAVQGWSTEVAISGSRRFERYQPLWLEDPLVHNDYPGLARVVNASPIPIATGENEYLREGFHQLLEIGVPYLLADLQRVGGLLEWEAVAGAASMRSSVLTPHIYPHVAVQLCSTLQQSQAWIEYIPWWDGLMHTQFEFRDGFVSVPKTPGIGWDFDDKALDRHALTPWESLLVPRTAVSVGGSG